MYKKGQLVVIRRKLLSKRKGNWEFTRVPMLCRIMEVEDGNYINSPCDFCDAMYCHCGYECKLEGTSLYYKKFEKKK